MLSKTEFKTIFDNYFDAVRGYIFYRCGDAEKASDIAQEVFMKVWEKREKFEANYIKALLYKMANDMFISDYRKISNKSDFKDYQVQIIEESPQDTLQFKELQKQYADALNNMSEIHSLCSM